MHLADSSDLVFNQVIAEDLVVFNRLSLDPLRHGNIIFLHPSLFLGITLLVLHLPLYTTAHTAFAPRGSRTQNLIVIDETGRAIAVDLLGNLLLLTRSRLSTGAGSRLWSIRSGGLGRRVGGGIEVGLAGDILLLPRVQAVLDSFGCAF
jgi:hypothetical protein